LGVAISAYGGGLPGFIHQFKHPPLEWVEFIHTLISLPIPLLLFFN